MYKSDNPMFKDLNDQEEQEYIKWADENRSQASLDKVGLYHPVIINRWKEKGLLAETKIIVVIEKGGHVKVYAKGNVEAVKVQGIADKTLKNINLEEYLDTHKTLIDEIDTEGYVEIW